MTGDLQTASRRRREAPRFFDVVSRYERSVRRRVLLIVALSVACVVAAIVDIAVGSGQLSVHQVIEALLYPAADDPTNSTIIWQIRAPMTMIALITGASLALSGVLMQTVMNNPLADPFTVGVSSAAGFGASIAIVFEVSVLGFAARWIPAELTIAANAFIFSLVTVLFITLLAARSGLRVETVTLLGIAIHFIFSALLAFAQYVSDPTELQSLIFWLLGSLLRATWLKVIIDGGLLLVLLPFIAWQAWSLTALRAFGEQASTYGVRVSRLRTLAMVAAALLAGSATATIGIVGFIGLVAPHCARLLVGEDQRFALPATAVCGALLLTLASLVSKLVIIGAVLPVGMVTEILGLPFFLAQILLLRRRRRI